MKATETKEEEMPDNSLPELEDAVIPFVWATEQPGKAKSTEPVKTELKPGAKPGEQKAGYAVVTLEKEIEAQPLPVNTSAQKAELTALTRALEMSEGKRANPKYAFGIIHAHGAIWKESITRKPYKIQQGRLLEAVNRPKEVAVIHCKAHQSGQMDVIKGNRKADETAKRAALYTNIAALVPERTFNINVPEYTGKEDKLAEFLKCIKTPEGW
ncbi:hypothetical protein GRJ2_003217100 [Grus japonensis]|uniref:RNase H type-1 domain-containing protein n=1 Tax=Grus japonensis TaxID=30415 RepID=A0ABC9YD02_GRUJA